MNDFGEVILVASGEKKWTNLFELIRIGQVIVSENKAMSSQQGEITGKTLGYCSQTIL